MSMSESFKNIFILFGILLVGGLGWYMFDQNRQMELRMTGGAGVNVQAETQRFIQQQRQLQQISVTTALSSDSDFQNLFSISSRVPSFPTGRANPFELPF